MTKHESLAAALAAFQLELPRVGKDNTAQVRSDKGNYSYKYADLSDVSAAILPKLGEHGLSFSTKPTLTDDGRFVLAYTLRHESGGEDVGQYPLNAQGTPQAVGSAITYARRYCLTAVTGVFPDEDDDGQAAEREARSQQSQGRNTLQPASPTAGADAARGRLRTTCEGNGWDLNRVGTLFAEMHGGQTLKDATDVAAITKFRDHLFGLAEADLIAQPTAA